MNFFCWKNSSCRNRSFKKIWHMAETVQLIRSLYLHFLIFSIEWCLLEASWTSKDGKVALQSYWIVPSLFLLFISIWTISAARIKKNHCRNRSFKKNWPFRQVIFFSRKKCQMVTLGHRKWTVSATCQIFLNERFRQWKFFSWSVSAAVFVKMDHFGR